MLDLGTVFLGVKDSFFQSTRAFGVLAALLFTGLPRLILACLFGLLDRRQ